MKNPTRIDPKAQVLVLNGRDPAFVVDRKELEAFIADWDCTEHVGRMLFQQPDDFDPDNAAYSKSPCSFPFSQLRGPKAVVATYESDFTWLPRFVYRMDLRGWLMIERTTTNIHPAGR